MPEPVILAIDQGTSGTKTVIFDSRGRIRAKATSSLESSFPRPGYVEQSPHDIHYSVISSVDVCLKQFTADGGESADIAACGISNQRETFILWDDQGEPLANAVVWQCKRSVDICTRLRGTALETEVEDRTGLIIDPYFSGTKLVWLYENDPHVRSAVDNGRAYFGTVDTWLLYRLTGGSAYSTDHTNASRTLLFNIDDLQWDRHLLDSFGLSGLNLPEVLPSSSGYGVTDFGGLLPRRIPITALIGDSHAAAFGEGCTSAGMAKATLGTGSSILLNTGGQRVRSANGMMATICWSVPGRVDYALEGIIVSAGSTIKWLRDQLGLFRSNDEIEAMAAAADDSNGVYVVPAFSGLGAPWWKMDLTGAIVGLTFGVDKRHIVRAALESIPYQVRDVIAAMERDSGIPLSELRADGGITVNRLLMQFMADVLETPVVNIGIADVSALGAAFMAGLHAGVYESVEDIPYVSAATHRFEPGEGTERARAGYEGWLAHVRQMVS
jgi:glycerol kinase